MLGWEESAALAPSGVSHAQEWADLKGVIDADAAVAALKSALAPRSKPRSGSATRRLSMS